MRTPDALLQPLQARLDYRFADEALLRQALTHRSWGQPHNERLEFLGDAVLDCVVAMLLYERMGQADEGALSRLRASLVRQQALADIARRVRLHEALRLGEGELRNGGAQRASILADALEAVLGAVLLDGGFEAARRVIGALYEPLVRAPDARALSKDAKTRLQELLQGRRLALPAYTVQGVRGAAHEQWFEVECAIEPLGLRVTGGGPSRRAAEQQAAQRALEALEGASPHGAA